MKEHCSGQHRLVGKLQFKQRHDTKVFPLKHFRWTLIVLSSLDIHVPHYNPTMFFFYFLRKFIKKNILMTLTLIIEY